MREYSLRLGKALMQGLSPDTHTAKNAMYLSTSEGLRPTKYGLAPLEPIPSPFDGSVYTSFPYAQVIPGHGGYMLASATSLYNLTDTVPMQALLIPTKDAHTFRPQAIIPSGSFHFVDMFKSWMLMNGACTIFQMNGYGAFGDQEHVLIEKEMQINTGCYHRGRVILGGFNSGNFYSTDWQAIISQMQEQQYIEFASPTAPGANFVFWSTIGGGDLLSLFYPEAAIYGILTDRDPSATLNEPLFLDHLRRNECGFMPMPWKGEILCIKSLGKRVAVYGTDGCALLNSAVDPIPTYGYEALLGFGISDRGAVGGDDSRHLLMDSKGCLWIIDAREGVQRVGYEDHFQGFLGHPVTIVYNQQQGEFYISGGGSTPTGYVLTSAGLGQLTAPVTSGFLLGSQFVAICGDVETTQGVVTSGELDFDHPDLKTLGIIEVQGANITGIEVAIQWFEKRTKTWITTSGRKVNTDGWAYAGVTATDFKIQLTIPDVTITRIDDIVIHYNISSNRAIRGIYANQAQQ